MACTIVGITEFVAGNTEVSLVMARLVLVSVSPARVIEFVLEVE